MDLETAVEKADLVTILSKTFNSPKKELGTSKRVTSDPCSSLEVLKEKGIVLEKD